MIELKIYLYIFSKHFLFTVQVRWIFVSVLFLTDINFIYYLQLSTERIEIPYVLLVYEADKFCNLAMNDFLFDQLSSIRSHYPAYTVCYLTNRLFSYINKRWVKFRVHTRHRMHSAPSCQMWWKMTKRMLH